MTGSIVKAIVTTIILIALGVAVAKAQGGPPASYTITSITPLDFGDVMPGSTVVIDPSTPQAAVINITRNSGGNPTHNLNIALPVSFSSGSVSIPITINSSDVQLIANNGSPTNPTTIPNITFSLGGGSGRTLEVRIGGSVTIPLNTVAGLYTGTFTISISDTAL